MPFTSPPGTIDCILWPRGTMAYLLSRSLPAHSMVRAGTVSPPRVCNVMPVQASALVMAPSHAIVEIVIMLMIVLFICFKKKIAIIQIVRGHFLSEFTEKSVLPALYSRSYLISCCKDNNAQRHLFKSPLVIFHQLMFNFSITPSTRLRVKHC